MCLAFTLKPNYPYSFELTDGYVSRFRKRYGAAVFENDVFCRLLDIDDCLVLVIVYSSGNPAAPCLEVEIEGDCLGNSIVEKARRQIAKLLGIYDDVLPFYEMAASDVCVAPFVEEFHGLHLPLPVSTYEALILAILGQHINGKGSHVVQRRFIENYGKSANFDGQIYYAFPRPAKVVEIGGDGLKTTKFGLHKANYIFDISKKVASRELDLDILEGETFNEVIKALTEIPGIGSWTSQWLLIRSLGYPDGFSDGDIVLQRIMGILVDGVGRVLAREARVHSNK